MDDLSVGAGLAARHCDPDLAPAATSLRPLPPCGGGPGWGGIPVERAARQSRTASARIPPLPIPQGGREPPGSRDFSRRAALVGLGATAAAIGLPSPAGAAEDYAKILQAITKGAKVQPGRVKLTLPEMAENGNVVSTQIEVESPMTAADHVKTIHVLAEKNPQVLLVRFHLGPRSGRAKLATNVRLADTQRVTCLAEMSDGSFWSGDANVIVTLAACIDSG